MGAYAKAIVAALITGLAALQSVLSTGHGITGAEWVGIASAVVTTAAVFVTPNTTTPTPTVLPEGHVPAHAASVVQPPEQPSV